MPKTKKSGQQAVALFYEEHPYPPPCDDLDGFRDRHITETPSPAFYAPLIWGAAMHQPPSILVAGCGTAQAAKLAIQNPDCSVVGIDISEASLEASRKLCQRYDLGNLELIRLPIEQVGELDARFDLIISTGVLHHLPDPDAGLRALRDRLAAGGRLHLKLYAPYGRAGVYMMQAYCRLLGTRTSEEDIRELLGVVRLLPEHHPLQVFTRRTPDMTTIGGTADALLHPQDRAYSVPELLQWLDRNGLHFLRWFFQAPYLARCSQWRQSPHGERLAALDEHAQAAAMELLRADMLMHEVIVAANGNPPPQLARPEDAGWMDYVPHPMPGIRINQLGIPDGVAAQFWHPAHRCDDIRLHVDETELAIYQLIDGQRSCREIITAASTLAGSGELVKKARGLITALWEYDAVMLSG